MPRLTDAELVTLAVMQALLGFTSEARWLRYARAHLVHLFRYLPQQPGYNKRLRDAAGLVRTVIRALALDTTLWTDDVWVVDSTPVECGRSRETAKRSELAGWAEYGYCASHSRYFWGLRLHWCAPSIVDLRFGIPGRSSPTSFTVHCGHLGAPWVLLGGNRADVQDQQTTAPRSPPTPPPARTDRTRRQHPSQVACGPRRSRR